MCSANHTSMSMQSMSKPNVTIYTDGGADPNPGIGGWAAVLQSGEHERVLTGNDPSSTNNRMELTAAIEALGALKTAADVTLFVDSEYVQKGMSQWVEGWQKKAWKGVKNADLWQRLVAAAAPHSIEWRWVKGHAGNEQNERVDKLARAARLEITPVAESAENLRLYIRTSYLSAKKRGAWAIVEVDGDLVREATGLVDIGSNNQLDLLAAIHAVERLPANQPATLVVVSDYLFQGVTRWRHGWRKRGWTKKDGQPVANVDWWKRLDTVLAERPIGWLSAKGSDSEYVKLAAKLASGAAAADKSAENSD